MTKSSTSYFFAFKKYCFLFFPSVFLISCGDEKLVLKEKDLNQTGLKQEIVQFPNSQLVEKDLWDFKHSDSLDILLGKHIGKVIPEIKKSIPKPVQFDYSRLEHSFLKMLTQTNQSSNLAKFQFICDENERWIYRCNTETGEIECFSMNSNKLRLLSSIK